jgi:hypothetical protein
MEDQPKPRSAYDESLTEVRSSMERARLVATTQPDLSEAAFNLILIHSAENDA